MNKTKDILYTIFMGLLLYVAGAVILGGAQYFINMYFSMDFISIILYFFLARYITSQVLKGVNERGKFYTIILCIYTALMYLMKDYVATTIYLFMIGYGFKELISLVPFTMYLNFITIFDFSLSIDGFFVSIISLLIKIIDLLVMGYGVYTTYKLTKVL